VSADQPPADPALDLALRIVSPYHPDQPPADEPQLFVGELPPDLPVPIPMPEESRLVGSYVHRQGDVTIFLDAALSPDQVFSYYTEQLSAEGWARLAAQEPPPGFRATARSVPQSDRPTYCRGPQGPALTIIATTPPGLPTEVRLYLQPDPRRNPCADPVNPEGSGPLIPDLAPPEGTGLFPRHAGGSDIFATTEAQLITGLDLAQVVAHYTGLLERNGWTRRALEEVGPYVWSTWAYTDDTRRRDGILFLSILKHPGLPPPAKAGALTERPEIVQQYTIETRVRWTPSER
jgi:hypothetical protein